MVAQPSNVYGPSAPRAFRDPSILAARRALLQVPEHALLRAFVERLNAVERGDVQDIDPLDGGTSARVLFLLEKPGPMTDASREGNRQGSGFISRDNDDPTAEAIFRFMQQAGIDRSESLLWNVIPWWNGTRRIEAHELQAGLSSLQDLIGLLPKLRVVVLVGRKAGRAAPTLSAMRISLIHSAHPSPIVRASRRDTWNRIPAQWAGARTYLE